MMTFILATIALALLPYAPQESVYYYPEPATSSVTIDFAGEPVHAELLAVRYVPFGIASVPIVGDTTDIPLDFSTVLIVTVLREDSYEQGGGVAVCPGGSYEWCDHVLAPEVDIEDACVPGLWTYGVSAGTLAITTR